MANFTYHDSWDKDYLEHSWGDWKNHKYIKKIGKRYIYAKNQLGKYARTAKRRLLTSNTANAFRKARYDAGKLGNQASVRFRMAADSTNAGLQSAKERARVQFDEYGRQINSARDRARVELDKAGKEVNKTANRIGREANKAAKAVGKTVSNAPTYVSNKARSKARQATYAVNQHIDNLSNSKTARTARRKLSTSGAANALRKANYDAGKLGKQASAAAGNAYNTASKFATDTVNGLKKLTKKKKKKK